MRKGLILLLLLLLLGFAAFARGLVKLKILPSETDDDDGMIIPRPPPNTGSSTVDTDTGSTPGDTGTTPSGNTGNENTQPDSSYTYDTQVQGEQDEVENAVKCFAFGALIGLIFAIPLALAIRRRQVVYVISGR